LLTGCSGWYSCYCLGQTNSENCSKEVSSQDAAMIKMSFAEPFWKKFNAVVGSIGQLIQGGLLDQDVIDHYNSQQIFPDCVIKTLMEAITIYNEDKKQKMKWRIMKITKTLYFFNLLFYLFCNVFKYFYVATNDKHWWVNHIV